MRDIKRVIFLLRPSLSLCQLVESTRSSARVMISYNRLSAHSSFTSHVLPFRKSDHMQREPILGGHCVKSGCGQPITQV